MIPLHAHLARTAVLAAASLLAGACGGPAEGTPPNLLLVVADDLGAGDVGAIATPHLDRLARRGVRFATVWAYPVCSPARHAIQFGREPGRDGIGGMIAPRGWEGIADERNPDSPLANASLAEVLGARGYATATFGKWNLSNGTGGTGDDGADGPRQHGYGTARAVALHNLRRSYDDWERVDDGVRSLETGYATRVQADALVDWLRTAPRPWFAQLSFSAPHSPLHAPPADLLPPGTVVADDKRAKFEAMVTALDRKLGDVLQAVDLGETVVLFTSDNGTSVAARPRDEGRVKGTLFEGGLRVPLVVAGAGVDRGGRTSRALVGVVDLSATLAELAGAPPPADADSVSFAACLTDPGAPGPRRFLFAEQFAPNGSGPRERSAQAARGPRFKLVREDGDGDGPEPPRERLVDLELSPDERRALPSTGDGLAPDAAAALAELRAFLDGRGAAR